MIEPLHHQPRPPIGPPIVTTTAMEPNRDERGNPSFHDLLRYGLHGSNTGARATEQQDRLAMSQTGPYTASHDVRGPMRQFNQYADNGIGRMASKRHRDKTRQLVGQALGDRRRLARDRIGHGGWKPHVAETAIQYIQRISWKEYPSTMSCVRKLMADAEALGEFCNDSNYIRWFLDENIHKLITFRAMEKDFEIPYCIVRRANQTTIDGELKYAWFRSVLLEFQELDTTAPVFWLRPYRVQSEGITTVGSIGELGRNPEGRTNGEATATLPAGQALAHPLGQNTNPLTIEPSQMRLGVNDHAGGHKRAPDSAEELDLDVLTTKVKRESTEPDFGDMPMDFSTEGRGIVADSRGGAPDNGATSARVGGGDDSEDKKRVGRRSLTVLLHGMRSDDAEESEHVQVYVPRTAKGVTINFL